jgi:hypothetical protein
MLLAVLFLVIILVDVYFKLKYFTLDGSISGLLPQFLFGTLIQSNLLFNGTTVPYTLAVFKDRYDDIFQF